MMSHAGNEPSSLQMRRGLQPIRIHGSKPTDQQFRVLDLRGNDGKLEHGLGAFLSFGCRSSAKARALVPERTVLPRNAASFQFYRAHPALTKVALRKCRPCRAAGMRIAGRELCRCATCPPKAQAKAASPEIHDHKCHGTFSGCDKPIHEMKKPGSVFV
jgi:hypothetical protein